MADKLYEEVEDTPEPKKGKSAPAPEPAPQHYEEVPAEEAGDPNTVELGEDDPFTQGAFQGATLGFSDEMRAALESLVAGTKYRENWNRRQTEMKRLRELYPKQYAGGEVSGAIASTFLPGGILGKVGLGFLKGGQMAKTAYTAAEALQSGKAVLTAAQAAKAAQALKQMSMMQKLGQVGSNAWQTSKFMAPAAMKQGAVTGLGMADQPIIDTSKNYENPLLAYGAYPTVSALKGALEGLISVPIAGTASAVLSPFMKPALEGSKWLGRKMMGGSSKFLFGVEKDAAKHILENPKLYDGPVESAGKVARERLIPMANKVSKEIDTLKDAAIKHLRPNSNAISANKAEELLFDQLNKRKIVFENSNGVLDGKFGTGPVSIFNSARETIKDAAGPKGFLTEKELHDLYETFASRGMYDSAPKGAVKELADAFKGFRSDLNQVLKKNTKYDEAMVPVRTMTNDINKLKNVVKLQQSLEQKFDPKTGLPTDAGRYGIGTGTVEGKIKTAAKSNEEIDRTIIDFAKKYMPDQAIIPDLIKRARVEDHLKKGGSPGARTLMASMFGESLPLPVRAGLMSLDIWGRPMFKAGARLLAPNAGERSISPYRLLAPTSVIGAGPATDPYFMGYPFHNISPEKYRQDLRDGKIDTGE